MNQPLPASRLRWLCKPESIPFQTTDDVEAISGVVGQEAALDALRFGIECDAPGQNVFVRGLTGTGRMTLVRHTLEDLSPKRSSHKSYGYVHNFAEPDRPRLVTLPPGEMRQLRRKVRGLAVFVRDSLSDTLNSPSVKEEREALENRRQEEIEKLTHEFQQELRAAGLDLVPVQHGPLTLPAVVPVYENRPVSPDEFEQLHADGKVSDEEHSSYREKRRSFQKRLAEVTGKVHALRRKSAEEIRRRTEETARTILDEVIQPIRDAFPGADVHRFLDEVTSDIVENRLFSDEEFDPLVIYGVNVLLEHDDGEKCPIIVENTPALAKLLGVIDREWGPQGPAPSDYRMIRAGSLLRANGGYLILDAHDVVAEPGAWKVLVRALRTGFLEIVPAELGWSFWQPALKPEPIPLQVRVILVGDAYVYHLLDHYDNDFGHLFKVLADFDSVLDRDEENVVRYAQVLARIVREEGLLPFDRTGMAALTEHGARIAAHSGKLSSRFGRLADIAREAAYLAKRKEKETVGSLDVVEAVRRTKERANLPARRFRELLADGTIHVATRGAVVGQVNGLAVIQTGPLSYGFPARITASVGAGTAGIIDIEGQASLSGSIHTKGFQILGGLLRHLLRAEHPLAFSASLTFEQSYGGIDGDSASCAEICCLLSALTDIPIRQSLAITGSIDQHGRVQAIGGVNEKIEGFFDACIDSGLDEGQGVVIPQSNVGDLMLRPDIVQACAEGLFHVYPVASVQEALEVLTGLPAGKPGEDGTFPEGTLLAKAVEKAREYWLKSLQRPHPAQGESEEK